MNVVWLPREKVIKALKDRVIKTDVVLDVGCGIRPQTFFSPLVHICIEPHAPYTEHLREQKVGDDPRYVFLNCTWDIIMKILPTNSVDTVFALDVIEHLEKADGLRFLQEAERVARRQIVISTPLGFFSQSHDDPKKPDRWGMDGGYWQTHRSGWQPEDFGECWELICCKSYHLVDQNEQLLEKPFGAIWAFRNLRVPARRIVRQPFNLNRRYRAMVRVLKRFLPHWAYSSILRVVQRIWMKEMMQQ